MIIHSLTSHTHLVCLLHLYRNERQGENMAKANGSCLDSEYECELMLDTLQRELEIISVSEPRPVDRHQAALFSCCR